MSDAEGTIFVVDDDEGMRRALTRLFRSTGLSVEGHASAEAVLERLPCDRVGCIVLDLEMGGLSGIELQERLGEIGCDVPIVFLTGRGDIPTSVRAMRSGAVDFLEKPADERELLATVRAALNRNADQGALRRQSEQWRLSAETLTPREHEVLRCVISGAPNKRTALYLGIAEKTVKVHRARVMDKMRSDSLADLVRICEAVGIRSDPSVAGPGQRRPKVP